MSSHHYHGRDTSFFFRRGLVLWTIQTLFLASGALLLMFSDAGWVTYFEQVRLVRHFMANPLEMIGVEAFGTFCMLVGICGVMDRDDSLLDTVWGGYAPLWIGACLLVLFVRGLYHPWWLFR